jgi:hypothetical protein
VIGAGLFYLFIFVSGFWLGRSGKPYNGIVFNIHKLIAVLAVVFLVITMCQISQVARLSAMELTTGVVTGVFFLGAIISGGVLSISKSIPAAILTMHQITVFLTALSTAATFYLLLTRK